MFVLYIFFCLYFIIWRGYFSYFIVALRKISQQQLNLSKSDLIERIKKNLNLIIENIIIIVSLLNIKISKEN